MADVTLANTSANMSGKTAVLAERDQTITGLQTFDRDPSAPFAVSASSAVVTNLDADKLDGLEATAFAKLGTAQTWTAAQRLDAGTVGAPGLGIGDTDVGLYSSGTNALDFTTNGIKALGIDSTQFIDSPTQPRAHVYNSAAISLANATETVLTFDTELFDVGAMHSTSSNTGRLTVPTGGDGLYLFIAQAQFAASATGDRWLRLYKNGSLVTGLGEAIVQPNAADTTRMQVLGLETLAATDYVEVKGRQSSGGALDCIPKFATVKLW
jgi:hypothetical protein